MSLGDRAERYLLEHMVGKNAWSMPTAYVALCTSAPGDPASGGGINEVANANNYARKATSGSDWASAAAGAIANSAAITFNQASGSWSTVTHFALMSSGTWGEGYMIGWAALTASKAIGNGDTPSFAIGELDITAD